MWRDPRAKQAGSPRQRHPDPTEWAVVLGAVKVCLAMMGARRNVGATANLGRKIRTALRGDLGTFVT